MIKYSIIIPTFNRNKNLSCCLIALARQSFPIEYWEVIVSDEGNDSAINVVQKYSKVLEIKYIWQKGITGNPGLSKNIAARTARGEALIFIDSDVILNDKAIENYDLLHSQYPEVIIAGRYDWLCPMNVEEGDIATRFDKVVSNQLPILHPPEPGPMPGKDARWHSDKTVKEEPIRDFALAMFGGNTLVPRKLFECSGGYDPKVVGHGGEDSELGWTMEELGAQALLTERTIGWHIYHSRPQAQNEIDVRKNIKYIDKKHGIGPDGRRKVPLE